MKGDPIKLEERVKAYLPKIRNQKIKARFINGALLICQHGEWHGLVQFGRHSGIPVPKKGQKIGGYAALCRTVVDHLRAAKIIDTGKETCFVNDLGTSLEDHRYVLYLHPDLVKEAS